MDSYLRAMRMNPYSWLGTEEPVYLRIIPLGQQA